MSSLQAYAAYNYVPAIHYLFCSNDHAIPIAVQQSMAASVKAGQLGLNRTLNSDHFVQLSHSSQTVQFIQEAIKWPITS